MYAQRAASTLRAFAGAILILSGEASAAPPPYPDAHAAVAEHYEAWFLSQCDNEWLTPEYRANFAEVRARHSAVPEYVRWPIDTERGILVNEAEKGPVSKVRWLVGEVEGDYDGPVGAWLWMNILLCDEADPHITPVLCEPDACYFHVPEVVTDEGSSDLRPTGDLGGSA